eukprot:5624579-Prymnesium_polylepis.1
MDTFHRRYDARAMSRGPSASKPSTDACVARRPGHGRAERPRSFAIPPTTPATSEIGAAAWAE